MVRPKTEYSPSQIAARPIIKMVTFIEPPRLSFALELFIREYDGLTLYFRGVIVPDYQIQSLPLSLSLPTAWSFVPLKRADCFRNTIVGETKQIFKSLCRFTARGLNRLQCTGFMNKPLGSKYECCSEWWNRVYVNGAMEHFCAQQSVQLNENFQKTLRSKKTHYSVIFIKAVTEWLKCLGNQCVK